MANRARTLSLAIDLILASIALFLAQCGDEPTGPKNAPPGTPSIPSGRSSGVTGAFHEFSSSATDPDGDSVAIRFSWGDGDISDWSSQVLSGQTVSMSHAWATAGIYDVRAQAKDSRGATSGWSASHQILISIPAPALSNGLILQETWCGLLLRLALMELPMSDQTMVISMRSRALADLRQPPGQCSAMTSGIQVASLDHKQDIFVFSPIQTRLTGLLDGPCLFMFPLRPQNGVDS